MMKAMIDDVPLWDAHVRGHRPRRRLIPSHPIPSHPIPSHPIPSHPIPYMVGARRRHRRLQQPRAHDRTARTRRPQPSTPRAAPFHTHRPAQPTATAATKGARHAAGDAPLLTARMGRGTRLRLTQSTPLHVLFSLTRVALRVLQARARLLGTGSSARRPTEHRAVVGVPLWATLMDRPVVRSHVVQSAALPRVAPRCWPRRRQSTATRAGPRACGRVGKGRRRTRAVCSTARRPTSPCRTLHPSRRSRRRGARRLRRCTSAELGPATDAMAAAAIARL
jgi:hypothetical protein